MATNTGKDHRQGAVRDRVQVKNPANNRWIKIDTKTGRIVDVKSTEGRFKGVRVLEKSKG